MAIALLKAVNLDWEQARENLRKDLDVLQTTINTLLGDKPNITAYQTVTQNFVASVFTPVIFHAHEQPVDLFGFHTPDAAIFIIPETGRYLILFTTTVFTTVGARWHVFLQKNEHAHLFGCHTAALGTGAGGDISTNLSSILQLNQGDTCQFVLFIEGSAGFTSLPYDPVYNTRASFQKL